MAKAKRMTTNRAKRDAKDAARWRWWRKAWELDDDCEALNTVQGRCESAADLDAAVDTAIRIRLVDSSATPK